jgi:hypothetical protein
MCVGSESRMVLSSASGTILCRKEDQCHRLKIGHSRLLRSELLTVADCAQRPTKRFVGVITPQLSSQLLKESRLLPSLLATSTLVVSRRLISPLSAGGEGLTTVVQRRIAASSCFLRSSKLHPGSAPTVRVRSAPSLSTAPMPQWVWEEMFVQTAISSSASLAPTALVKDLQQPP